MKCPSCSGDLGRPLGSKHLIGEWDLSWDQDANRHHAHSTDETALHYVCCADGCGSIIDITDGAACWCGWTREVKVDVRTS